MNVSDTVQAYVMSKHVLPAHLEHLQYPGDYVVVDHGQTYTVYRSEDEFLLDFEWV